MVVLCALELLVRQCRTTAHPGIDPPARHFVLNHAKEPTKELAGFK
jgi:hypothetical protein